MKDTRLVENERFRGRERAFPLSAVDVKGSATLSSSTRHATSFIAQGNSIQTANFGGGVGGSRSTATRHFPAQWTIDCKAIL
jgi:hypothetical protein